MIKKNLKILGNIKIIVKFSCSASQQTNPQWPWGPVCICCQLKRKLLTKRTVKMLRIIRVKNLLRLRPRPCYRYCSLAQLESTRLVLCCTPRAYPGVGFQTWKYRGWGRKSKGIEEYSPLPKIFKKLPKITF